MKQKEQFVGFDKREYNPIVRPKTEQLLKDLLQQNKVQKTLEIGTYIGYSAAVMLQTLPNLQLVTIEKDAENFEYAKQNLKEYGGRVQMLLCDAFDFLQSAVADAKDEKNLFDFIFLDGPKGQYVKYLPYLKKLLKSGGVLMADDILFYGEVQSEQLPKPKHRAIVLNLRKFLADLQGDPDFETQIYAIEDGVAVAKKK